MAKTLTNRHQTALGLIKTSSDTLPDLCSLLLAAVEKTRREAADPHADPAVRLIAAKFTRLASVTDANRFALIEECERRLAAAGRACCRSWKRPSLQARSARLCTTLRLADTQPAFGLRVQPGEPEDLFRQIARDLRARADARRKDDGRNRRINQRSPV